MKQDFRRRRKSTCGNFYTQFAQRWSTYSTETLWRWWDYCELFRASSTEKFWICYHLLPCIVHNKQFKKKRKEKARGYSCIVSNIRISSQWNMCTLRRIWEIFRITSFRRPVRNNTVVGNENRAPGSLLNHEVGREVMRECRMTWSYYKMAVCEVRGLTAVRRCYAVRPPSANSGALPPELFKRPL